MRNPALESLDQVELVQLALNAGAQNDGATAIGLLKEAASRADATATAHYLLGAEYAQGRLYERAIDEMEAAIALDPGLSIARFQLGLLLVGAQQADKARQVLEPLDEIEPEHYLRHFGAALRDLMEGRLTYAVEQLDLGVELNRENPALNGDMRHLADEIRKSLPANSESPENDETPASEGSGLYVLLSAYVGNTLS